MGAADDVMEGFNAVQSVKERQAKEAQADKLNQANNVASYNSVRDFNQDAVVGAPNDVQPQAPNPMLAPMQRKLGYMNKEIV